MKQKQSWKNSRFIQVIYTSVVAIFLIIVAFLQTKSESQGMVINSIQVWENDLTLALSRGDKHLIEVIGKTILRKEVSYVEFRTDEHVLVSLPTLSFPEKCHFRIDRPLERYGQNVGSVTACFSGSEMLRAMYSSPFAFVIAFLFPILIGFGPFLSLIGYRRELFRLLEVLEDWNSSKWKGEINDSDSRRSKTKDPVGRRIIELFEKGIQERLEIGRQAERLGAVAQMTQMLAHDVRRPFSMLKMLLDGISKAKTPTQIQMFASKGIPETIRAMNSVNGLIEDVMEIGSNSEIFLSPAKPETLLEAALGDVFQSFPAANVSISYELKHVSHVNVESGKVLRAFANILGNAVQAMQQVGVVRIDTSNIEENGQAYVQFVLGNNGPPIAAEHLPKLFEAFFTSGKKGGTGLGLAIAHKIVTAHGGKIWCESSPDVGVEFHLTLPAIEPKLVPDVSALPKSSQEICARFKSFGDATPDDDAEVRLEISLKNLLPDLGRRLTVLIVDDENIYRNSLTESLTRNQDLASLLEVVSAEHSNDALVLLNPDLAIVDVDLGPTSLSGFELVQEMRKRGQEGFVCIHSNRISASDSKTAIAQGADAFLPKPMSRAHLLKLLCQALERLGLVDPTLSSSNTVGTMISAVNKPVEVTRRDENSMVSAFVDDVATIRMSWEMDWPIGKLVTFASPEKFWSHVDTNAGFLDSLSCIVTDLNFGDLSTIDGHEFARQLKQRTQLPIFVASNSSAKVEDFGGTVDGVLEKAPPDRATLERFLFWKN